MSKKKNKQQREADTLAREISVIEKSQAEEAKKISRLLVMKKLSRGEPGVVFDDHVPSKCCVRPNAIPAGCSAKGTALAWHLEDISVAVSQTQWKRNGWKVRKEEKPAGQRRGLVGGNGPSREWDVFGDWQVEPFRSNATMPRSPLEKLKGL